MALTFDEGKALLIKTIRGGEKTYHRDYKRTCYISKTYKAFITGEDVEELLVQFAPREDADQFKQRCALTEVITPYIAGRVMTPMYKVGRTLATKTFTWDKSKTVDDNRKKLNELLAKYAGDESLDDFLTHAMVELDSIDPNAFIVTDLEELPDSTPANRKYLPYPFIVTSEEAINYEYKNNVLQYLLSLVDYGYKKYTLFLENDGIIATQLTEEQYKAVLNDNPDAEIVFKDPDKREKDEIYLITTANYKAGVVPAIRVGTIKDLKTDSRTCVPLIHKAKSFFKKSITTISEFDLTNALHVFPQKIQYDSVCPGDIANNIICQDGKAPDGSTCAVCRGTGFNEHKSASDILRVKMPGKLDEVVSLENFITYKYPPTEILKFLKELGLYEYPDLATKAVYTSELYTADQITTTATEKMLDLDSVYDTLKPFADKWSTVYKHIAKVAATYINVGSGLVVEHKFPKDFKMKTLTQLLDDLQKATSSKSPSYMIREINRDIAQKIFVDKPEELLKIDVKDRFDPFPGKTESEIGTIINNGLVSKFKKVLWANFDMIFQELEQENNTELVSFYRMDTIKQKELIDQKVLQYIQEIDGEEAATRAMPFGKDIQAPNGADTQDYNAGDAVTYNNDPVEIIDANPGPDGGIYTVQMQDGTQKEVSGKELMAVQNA